MTDGPGMGEPRTGTQGVEPRVVTARPGRRWVLFAACAVLLLVVFGVASMVGADRRTQWDQGSPVALVVTRDAATGAAVFRDPVGARSWTLSEGDLRGLETRPNMVGRVVGDCRCQLALVPPARPPMFLLALAAGSALLAIPHLRARRRWRGLGALARTGQRPVHLTPVWRHRPGGVARFGAVARAPGIPDVHLELAGTPVAWFPPDRRALMAGPDPATGLVALVTHGGQVAVASAAPQLADAGARKVARWSADLARLTCPPTAVGPEPAEVGGNQRVRISLGGGPAVARFGPATGSPVRQASLALSTAGVIVTLALRPSFSVVVAAWVALIAVEAFLPLLLAGRWARRPPLAEWPDRRAARSAAAAAMVAGLAPLPAPRLEASGSTGSPGSSGSSGSSG